MKREIDEGCEFRDGAVFHFVDVALEFGGDGGFEGDAFSFGELEGGHVGRRRWWGVMGVLMLMLWVVLMLVRVVVASGWL